MHLENRTGPRFWTGGGALLGLSLAATLLCAEESQPKVCKVSAYDCGALWSDGAWRGCTVTSDGRVVLGLCSHSLERSAVVMRFDPRRNTFETLGDLGEITGARPGSDGPVPQGKIHSPFYEYHSSLYFSTTIAPVEYSLLKQRTPYPGGCFVRYDLVTARFTVVGRAASGEGIISLAADLPRKRLYGVTYPSGHFLVCNVEAGTVEDLGETEIEWNEPAGALRFVDVCRCLAVDPESGKVYGSRTDGIVYVYDPAAPGAGKLEFTKANVREGVFRPSSEKPSAPSPWRMMIYDSKAHVFYGTHRGTASLFRFDPRTLTFEPLARLAPGEQAPESKDTARLGLALGPNRVLYHTAQGPGIRVEGRDRQARYESYLVSYDLETGAAIDYGALMAPGDRRVIRCDSLAAAPDGTLYALAFVELLDAEKRRKLEAEKRGTGSSLTVGGCFFEMNVIAITPRK